jgi:cation transport regulator
MAKAVKIPAIRRHLPPHAQDIYYAAFNQAFVAHACDPRQEKASHPMVGGHARENSAAGNRWPHGGRYTNTDRFLAKRRGIGAKPASPL